MKKRVRARQKAAKKILLVNAFTLIYNSIISYPKRFGKLRQGLNTGLTLFFTPYPKRFGKHWKLLITARQ